MLIFAIKLFLRIKSFNYLLKEAIKNFFTIYFLDIFNLCLSKNCIKGFYL